MFNPHPAIQITPLDSHRDCVVIDDALSHPEALINHAVSRRDDFRMAAFNAFPGLELPASDEVASALTDFFNRHVRSLLNARRTVRMHSRLSIVSLSPDQLQPIQRLCHRDRLDIKADEQVCASVLYLFKNPSLGGTLFFTPKKPMPQIEQLMRDAGSLSDATFTEKYGIKPGYIAASNEYFELAHTIEAKFNRLIFYDGGMFHSSHIPSPEELNADPLRGRLTLNGFFTCRKLAQ